jgi:hypothetical protein
MPHVIQSPAPEPTTPNKVILNIANLNKEQAKAFSQISFTSIVARTTPPRSAK